MKNKFLFGLLFLNLAIINCAHAIDQDDELFDKVDSRYEQEQAMFRAARKQQEQAAATQKQIQEQQKAQAAYQQALQSGAFNVGAAGGGMPDSKEAQAQKVFGGGALNKIMGIGGAAAPAEAESSWGNLSTIKGKPDDSYDYKLKEELAKPLPKRPSMFDNSARDRMGDLTNRLNSIKRSGEEK